MLEKVFLKVCEGTEREKERKKERKKGMRRGKEKYFWLCVQRIFKMSEYVNGLKRKIKEVL